MKNIFARSSAALLSLCMLTGLTSCAAKEANEPVANTPADEANEKYIALTFDDGPNTSTTNEVLDILEKYNVKASFFLIGDNIDDKSAKTVKRAHDMGCEIDNHSKSHDYMNKMTVDEIKYEIKYVDDYVYKITGEYPSFFRPPFIAVSDDMYSAIDIPFICGKGCDDWMDDVTAKQRADAVIKNAKDGQIVLLHDAEGNKQTVKALKTIIPTLQKEGYTFVTLNELFECKNVEPDEDHMYSIVPDTDTAA